MGLMSAAIRRAIVRKGRLLQSRGEIAPGEFLARLMLPQDFSEITDIHAVEANRFGLNGVLVHDEANQAHQQGPLEVFSVRDVNLWPAVGAVRTGSGGLIRQSFFDAKALTTAIHMRCLGKFPVVDCQDTCASLGHVNRGFYHLISDSIPKIFALNHPSILSIPLIRLFHDRRFSSTLLELIESLVPANVRLQEIGYVSRVAAKSYVHLPFLSCRRTDATPEWARQSLGYAPAQYLAWFRSGAFTYFGVRLSDRPRRRIYVSRSNALVRRIVNETVLTDPLLAAGFEVVRLEELSLRQQVELFASSSHVVGQHGAGLTNILYMEEGSTVVEILSSPHKQKHYKLLADSLGVAHQFVAHHGANKNADIVADRHLVQSVMAAISV